VSPIRDPKDRSLRRQERAVDRSRAERETGPPGTGAPRHRPAAEAEAPLRPPADGGLDEEALDRLPTRGKHGGRRSDSERRRIGRLRVADAGALPAAAEELLPDPATVVAVTRGQCEVEIGAGEVAVAHLPKALALQQQSELAVGDRVLLERRRSGALAVARLLPRASRLSRPDPYYAHRERVLAANLDLALIVASLRRPPLVPGLIDRFLVALAWGEVPAAIAVNKVDLVERPRDSDEEVARLAPYRALGLPVVLCSARSGEGLAELSALLAGRLVAFVGHSGAGKSSLLNALSPAAGAAVGEISEGVRRGRHTTARARIYPLPGGARVVDTPGIREFGLWQMSADELARYFEEFAPIAAGCRFADCTHVHEPRCAVRDAAERGELPRYATYLRMLASLTPS
jgi:ribosome biogenesis GTPase